MARYAVIDPNTGQATNVIVWDGVTDYNPGNGHLLALDEAIAINPQDFVPDHVLTAAKPAAAIIAANRAQGAEAAPAEVVEFEVAQVDAQAEPLID